MIKHYLKIAFRNLWKYRTQSIISILGLAVGFTCLTLCLMWLRYEQSFDNFHTDGERIFAMGNKEQNLNMPCGLYAPLKKSYPEVEQVTSYAFNKNCSVEGRTARLLTIDTCFTQLFPIHLLKGTENFYTTNKEVALSATFAEVLFGKENPIGREIKIYGEPVTVGAVVKAFDEHSVLAFDVLEGNYTWVYQQGNWRSFFVKLKKGANRQAFNKKIDQYAEYNEPNHITTISLPEMRSYQSHDRALNDIHLHIFCAASLLMVVSALINFLVLYLIRLHGRNREAALRLVNGSSGKGLLTLFFTEYALSLILAFFLGMLLIEWTEPAFAALSGVKQTNHYIVLSSIPIMALTMSLCLLISLVPINRVRRQALQRSLSGQSRRNDFFRKTSIGIQLTVSLGFIFCTAVMMKQLNFIQRADWGFAIEGRAMLCIDSEDDQAGHDRFTMKQAIAPQLKALPSVTEALPDAASFGYPYRSGYSFTLQKDEHSEPVECIMFRGIWDMGNPLYGFTVLEGTLPRIDSWEPNEVVLTESIRRALGLEKVVGQTLYCKENLLTGPCVVVAVIHDIYYGTVVDKPMPLAFLPYHPYRADANHIGYISLSFPPKARKQLTQEVEKLFHTKYPDLAYHLEFSSDHRATLTQSENNLMHLLSILSAVCILVAVFGIYSIVTLACNQRRKEIALRKVNGATVRDILKIFVKEYGLLLVASSVVAFTVGTYLMHGWILQYSQRTPLSWWVYTAIFVLTALVIVLCVGYRVWHTANENPAVVIKSE